MGLSLIHELLVQCCLCHVLFESILSHFKLSEQDVTVEMYIHFSHRKEKTDSLQGLMVRYLASL